MNFRALLFVFLGLYQFLVAPVTATELASPDGKLVFSIQVADGGANYSISFDGVRDQLSGELGLQLDPESTFAQHVLANAQEIYSSDEAYNGLLFGSKKFAVEVRAFNRGIAFRYEGESLAGKTLNAETTSFEFPAGTKIWHQTNDSTSLSHEGQMMEAALPGLDGIYPAPVTLQLPSGMYALLSEWDVRAHSQLRLVANSETRTLSTAFFDAAWQLPENGKSAWRVVLLSRDLDGLMNNGVLDELSGTPDPELYGDADYIQPGKALWHWLPEGGSGATPERVTAYIDGAAKYGFDYVLIDDGWKRHFASGGRDRFAVLKELADYAGRKNVGLWAWLMVKDVKDQAARRALFEQFQAAGVRGLKIDFFDKAYGHVEALAAGVAYEEILADAARHDLMVNYHGASKPVGTAERFPNEMTREGVRGQEFQYKTAAINPYHNALLYFSRFVLGHGDYTPLHLDPVRINMSFSSLSHQMVLAGIYDSPVQNWSLAPEDLDFLSYHNPSVIDYLQRLPTVWDETRILPGSKMGGNLMVARRAGGDWYLFAMTGAYDPAAINMVELPSVSLSFLGDGTYRADIWQDETAYRAGHKVIAGLDASAELTPTLFDKGGFIARFLKNE